MAMQRLKIDPKVIDLMMTAIVLKRRDKLQHAGHYAFLALGRVLAKTLPDEDGPTTPTNFTWRMDQLVKEMGFSKDWRKKNRNALDQDQILSLSESKHDPDLPGPEYHIIRRCGQLHTRTICRDQI